MQQAMMTSDSPAAGATQASPLHIARPFLTIEQKEWYKIPLFTQRITSSHTTDKINPLLQKTNEFI
jgi:hypothetical protein